MKLTEYDVSNPYEATVVSTERITDPGTDEVRHITLAIQDPTFSHVEGQSIGVVVHGPHDFGNEDHVRLYSIASSRLGEDGKLSEISICVRRCFYIDEVSGERFPGVASNFLCDAAPGQILDVAGPYGRQFLAPRDTSCNLLMIGIGTGIAPFRAFMKHIYEDRKKWEGKVRLFYGARTGMDLLYMNDQNDDLTNYYDEETFKAFEALSPRPAFDEPAQIGNTLKDNAAEVWELIQDPKTYVYVSGLAKLEDTLDQTLAKVAGSEEKWQEMKEKMTKERRWSTLFYE